MATEQDTVLLSVTALRTSSRKPSTEPSAANAPATAGGDTPDACAALCAAHTASALELTGETLFSSSTSHRGWGVAWKRIRPASSAESKRASPPQAVVSQRIGRATHSMKPRRAELCAHFMWNAAVSPSHGSRSGTGCLRRAATAGVRRREPRRRTPWRRPDVPRSERRPTGAPAGRRGPPAGWARHQARPRCGPGDRGVGDRSDHRGDPKDDPR